MLSTFTKRIIGMQKTIRPSTYRDRSGISWLIIYKGYEPHYQWFQQNQASFKDNAKIYCFDRCSVDMALEMAARNTTKLSYISTRNYQTVTAVAHISPQQGSIEANDKEKSNNGQFFKTAAASRVKEQQKKRVIDGTISGKARGLLKGYDFVIRNTFLDIHPLEAYQKMCGYLLIRSDPKILQYFQGFRCTQEALFNSFHVLPILNELRTKLFVHNELKVRSLERKAQITISDDMVASYLKRWKDEVKLQTFEHSFSSFEEKEMIGWVIGNKFGEEVSKKDILNQKYRRYSYAIFA